MGRGRILVGVLLAVLAGCGQSGDPAGDLVLVEGGRFIMGNPYDTADPDEMQLHEVVLEDFRIGRCEVSVGQFREFVEATGYVTTAEKLGNAMVFVDGKVSRPDDASWRKPYFEQHDGHPAVCISWWDAVEYCNWRSDREGLARCYTMDADSTVAWDRTAEGYRLATEAEWEYAGRCGGREQKYTWGDGEPVAEGIVYANTRDEAAHRQFDSKEYWEGCDDGYAYTAPVDSLAPNALGLCGLSGNVYEWCWDWYSETWYEESPVDNPVGPPTGEMHACRDAGFACPSYQEVVSSRGKGKPDLAFSWGGFRIVRSALLD